jgi:hypothetical protein
LCCDAPWSAIVSRLHVKVHRNRIVVILTLVSIAAFFMAVLSIHNRRVVAEAHRSLQKQGIRTKPEQFDFLVPKDFQARGVIVLGANIALRATLDRDIKAPVLRALGGHRSTLPIVWKSNYFAFRNLPDPWPDVRRTLEEHRADIDAARSAIIAGPFGFRVKAQDGVHIKIGHLDYIPSALATFNLCIVADLHDGRFDEAWTNVLAASRCITAWKAEPTHFAQIRRFQMTSGALAGMWQALQAGVWSESQLNALEREWSSVNFFAALPEMVEYNGAYTLQLVNMVGTDFTSSNLTIHDLLNQPKQIPGFINGFARLSWYRARGFYDDQRDILFYYRDRYLEVRRAVSANTLAEMLALPGMTNVQTFVPRNGPFIPSFVSDNLFSIVTADGDLGVIGSAAEAEIRRRLILAAIALEKHRVRAGTYPEKLEGPHSIDFADGQKLRYQRLSENRFHLYSAGLDGINDHGRDPGPFEGPYSGIRRGADMLWPSSDSTP